MANYASNYGSPPISSAPYGASPYAPVGGMPGNGVVSTTSASSYPGMINSAGAAGVGAGGGYAPTQQSSYPGMASQLSNLPAQSQQQQQMQMQMQQGGGAYGGVGSVGSLSPALTGTTVVNRTAPPGVTLLKDQMQQQHPFSPPPGGTITPGSLTYTTTTDHTGRTTYHHFKAEPATYRSPQGITYTGIQWVGCGSSGAPPPGAAPAGADFPQSLRGGPGLGSYVDNEYPDDSRAYRDWGKEEQKRRKKEEKEANKRAAHWEQQQRMRERAEEKEYRRAQQMQQPRGQEDPEIIAARERDAMREREFHQRTRRSSTASRPGADGLGPVSGAGVYGDAPRQGGGIYDTGRERERSVYGSLGPDVERDLEQRMGDMRVGGGGGPGSRLTADYGAPPPLGAPPVGVRSRRNSMSLMPVPTVGGSVLPGTVAPGGGIVPGARGGRTYDDAEYIDRDFDRDEYPIGPTTTISRRASMHLGGGIGGRGGPSPYRSTSPLPPVMNTAGMPVYPPGHIYEGEPIPGGASGALSRSHSPVPGTAPYPSSMSNPGSVVSFAGGAGAPGGYGGVVPRTPRHDRDLEVEHEMLSTPEAFTRQLNRAQAFTPFEMMKIQDLDDFLRSIPRFPVVLTTHDVYAEEWGRLMGDLSLAWQNRLPLPANGSTGRMPKRTSLVSDLLDSWNYSFFIPRGVEVVMYKGRERLSGRGAGRPETRLPRMDAEDSWSDSASSDDDFYSDMDPAMGHGGRQGHYGLYGRHDERFEQEMRESRQYRRQKKEEKRRRAKERKLQHKQMNKKYTLYMCYVEPTGNGRDSYGRVGGAGGGSSYGGSQGGGYAGSGYASSGHGL